MDLRRATIEDRSRVELFQRAAYTRTEAAVSARAIPLEWDYGLVFEQCEVWLYEREGMLASVLILRVLEDELFLESIATAPDFAGTGCGRQMLEATFRRAAEIGLNRVGLITNSRNPALGWYGRMGFSVIHEEVEENRRIVHMTRPVSTLGASQG